MWEHMRKLWQRDVRIKGINEAAVAVGEVADFNALEGSEIEPGWRLNTIPGKGDARDGHIL
ncbi:hypothetical protein ES708_06269 [subsurface metagenome]